MNKIKKIFGNIDLNYKKIIIFAIISGIYTALMAIIPQVRCTSLNTITVTMEVWILFGIIIIMNSKSNKDSALKCFIFFLISQPLVYLIEVPFTKEGWGIFHYYKYWFIWTILCLPMGYLGYYIKKDKWWGYLILLPMIILLASSYNNYFHHFTFYFPYYFLIILFCAISMLIYPNVLFNNKKIKIFGTTISLILIILITIKNIVNPYVYSTDLLFEVNGENITNEYSAYLEDSKYGNITLMYIDTLEAYSIHADFEKAGKTKLIIKLPDESIKEYNLDIYMDTYTLKEIK